MRRPLIKEIPFCIRASLVAQLVKNLPEMLVIWFHPWGLGRSPGGEPGNPLQYSCLENPRGQRSLGGYKNEGKGKDEDRKQVRDFCIMSWGGRRGKTRKRKGKREWGEGEMKVVLVDPAPRRASFVGVWPVNVQACTGLTPGSAPCSVNAVLSSSWNS